MASARRCSSGWSDSAGWARTRPAPDARTATSASSTTSTPSGRGRSRAEGATGAASPTSSSPRSRRRAAVWVMVPAGEITERAVDELAELPRAGRHVIDGGNTRYHDDIRARRELGERGIHYVDVGTSGGVFGLERGFCLMVGGEDEVVSAARAAPHLARARGSARPSGPGPHRRAGAGGARLAPLRAGRCRALREDGAQRHRVRADGRVRRGPERPPPRGRGQRRTATQDAETAPLGEPRALPLRPRPRGDHRGLAARERRRVVAARPDRDRAPRVTDARGVRGPRLGLGRGPLDVDRRDRDRHVRHPSSRPRCSSGSPRAARRTSRTACSPRCASSSAATPRSRTERQRRTSDLGAELVRPCDAGQRHRQLELGEHAAEDVAHTGLAAEPEAVDVRASEEHRPRAERQRLDDVGARANAAVEQHLESIADRVDHRGERVERRDRPVDLATAVIRHDHRVDARPRPRVARRPGAGSPSARSGRASARARNARSSQVRGGVPKVAAHWSTAGPRSLVVDLARHPLEDGVGEVVLVADALEEGRNAPSRSRGRQPIVYVSRVTTSAPYPAAAARSRKLTASSRSFGQ